MSAFLSTQTAVYGVGSVARSGALHVAYVVNERSSSVPCSSVTAALGRCFATAAIVPYAPCRFLRLSESKARCTCHCHVCGAFGCHIHEEVCRLRVTEEVRSAPAVLLSAESGGPSTSWSRSRTPALAVAAQVVISNEACS